MMMQIGVTSEVWRGVVVVVQVPNQDASLALHTIAVR